MGKISEVYYEEIDPNVCTLEEAGEFYYHFNLLGSNSMFHNDYEKYEARQIDIRNKAIGDAKKCGDIKGHSRIDSSILAISSLKNKVVIITNII